MHLFRALDRDQNGFITRSDIELAAQIKDIPLSEYDTKVLMAKLDVDREGSVDFGQFTKAISQSDPSFLDQIQRTLIGVSQDGGTVYVPKSYPLSASTTGRSSAVPSSRRVLSVTDAIHAKMDTFRPSSGKLNHFYHGLEVPMRNLPWYEETRHTVEPFDGNNPQYLTDRRRIRSFSRSCSIGSAFDPDLPHNADKLITALRQNHSISRLRTLNQNQAELLKSREIEFDQRDLRRIESKSRAISAYHEKVNAKVCHVI